MQCGKSKNRPLPGGVPVPTHIFALDLRCTLLSGVHQLYIKNGGPRTVTRFGDKPADARF